MAAPDLNPVGADVAEILTGLGQFVDRVVLPLEDAHAALLAEPRRVFDANGAYTPEVQSLMRTVRLEAAEAGYYTMMVPEELGGGGQGAIVNFSVWEYLHHRYGPARLLPYLAVSHWSTGPSPLLLAMSDQLREELWTAIASGRSTLCFALSEPDAGSDALAITTRARHDGDQWVLTGTKQWITNSPYAEYAIVFALTGDKKESSRGVPITAFVVPTASPGFQVDSIIRLFGDLGGNEAIISLNEVHVPERNVLGMEGRGLDLALGSVNLGRMYNAGRCVGLARWALEQATEYALQRKAFGQPISDYQGVSFQLADSAIEIYAAKSMSLDCAARLERGAPAIREVSMVKAYTTEMCCRVYDRCMQVLGGMGLTQETRLYEGWQQARVVRIADGSAEIMRRNIARALFKGDVSF